MCWIKPAQPGCQRTGVGTLTFLGANITNHPTPRPAPKHRATEVKPQLGVHLVRFPVPKPRRQSQIVLRLQFPDDGPMAQR